MFRRVACCFCALILCVCCCVRPAAAAAASATVAVTGGSIAAGGLSAGGLASVVFPPVAVILGLTLAGAGINTVITDAARESGMTKTEFISSKWDDFTSSIGQTQAATNDAIIRNTEIAADGTIALASGACDLITQFGDWLFSTDNVVDSDAPVVAAPSLSLDGIVFQYAELGVAYPIDSNMDRCSYFMCPDGTNNSALSPLYFVSCSNGCIAISASYDSVNNNRTPSKRYYDSTLSNASYIGSSTGTGHVANYSWSYYPVPGLEIANPMYSGTLTEFVELLKARYGDVVVEDPGSSEDVYFGGNDQTWTENKDLLNPAYDQPVLLNPDYLNGLSDDLAGDYTIGAADYLSALRDAWEALGTDAVTSIPLTAVDTGLVTDFPVANTATANPTISNTAVGDQMFTPAISYDTLADPSQVADGLQVNVTEIFPFCIPFDIARVATLLEAEPVAPVIRWRFYIPEIVDYTLEIDLAAWEPVAVVLRGGEVLLFVVGLAFVTRSLIRG